MTRKELETLNAEMLEALKALMEGNHSPNERGVWGCRCVPTNDACTMAAAAIAAAERLS